MPTHKKWQVILTIISLLVITAGSILFMDRLSGTSPDLCQDTIEDNAMVGQCLRYNACPFKGIGTSFGRFHQGLAWHNTRVLMAYTGMSIHQVFLVVRFLNALGLIVLVIVAWRIFGGIEAALGLVLTAYIMVHMEFTPWILNNSNILFFLGVLAVAVGLLVVRIRRPWVVLVFAALMALIGDTHIAATPMVLSLLWVVWLAEPKPGLVLYAGLVWSLVLFVLSPGTWITNISNIGTLTRGTPGAMGNIWDTTSVPTGTLALLAGLAAWSTNRKKRAQNKALATLIALVLPELLVFIIAGMLTGIDTTDKYLIQTAPAIGLLGGVAIVRLTGSVGERVFHKSMRAGFLIAPVAVSAAGMILWLWSVTSLANARAKDPMFLSRLTIRETAVLTRYLRSNGWTRADLLAGLKAPLYLNLIEAVRPGLAKGPGTQKTAYVIRIKKGVLPDTLPRNWHLLAKKQNMILYFVDEQGVLDWHGFQVCTRSCQKTGFVRSKMSFGPTYTMQGFPAPAKDLHQALILKIPIRPAANQAMRREVYMPQVPGWCSGRIVGIEGCKARITDKGRTATYTCLPGQQGRLVVRWSLGSPQCGAWDYYGLPPFFVEASPGNAGLIKRALLSYPQRLE